MVTEMYGMKHLEILLFLAMTMMDVGSGFLLSNGQCIAPSPCTCTLNTVHCDVKSLTDVPVFVPTHSKDYSTNFYIYLNSNQISTIYNQAFQNLSSLNITYLVLRLSGNGINRIDSNAFDGIENNTFKIDLTWNNLTTIPAAFSKLNNLKQLLIQGNPIKTFESSVISILGRSLSEFHFDMQYFKSWPQSLRSLSLLSRLVIDNIPFNHISYNAFDSMSSTLTDLTITNSKLYRIPTAICHLHKLHTFNFNNNTMLETNSSIFEPCSQKLIQLTTLAMFSDGLTHFPDVLLYFPSLKYLNLDNNDIRFIPVSAIPFNTSLNHLSLNSNSLFRIPYAINKIKQLQLLYLTNNKITTIEDNDFSGLSSLTSIEMYSNPIEYVSPSAFMTNDQISRLYLQNTKLTAIPEAVLHLPKLNALFFTGNDVKCTCEMSYLKGLNVTKVSIFTGNCDNRPNDPIKQYIQTTLTYCP